MPREAPKCQVTKRKTQRHLLKKTDRYSIKPALWGYKEPPRWYFNKQNNPGHKNICCLRTDNSTGPSQCVRLPILTAASCPPGGARVSSCLYMEPSHTLNKRKKHKRRTVSAWNGQMSNRMPWIWHKQRIRPAGEMSQFQTLLSSFRASPL